MSGILHAPLRGTATNDVPIWNAATSRWDYLSAGANDEVLSVNAGVLDYRKIVDAMVDAAAGIATSKIAFTTTPYTPTWTATSSNPSLGNGTAQGEYMKLGDFVFGWLAITAGSTTTFGTGTYEFGVPFARATLPGGLVNFGSARILDGGTPYVGHVGPAVSASAVRIVLSSATTSGQEVDVTNTVPMTPANGDDWAGTFTYRAA